LSFIISPFSGVHIPGGNGQSPVSFFVDKKDDQITSAKNLGVGGVNIFTLDMPTAYFSDNGSPPEHRFGLFDGNPVLGAKFFNKLLFPYNFGDYQI
jgi:hypothetical protein